MNRIRGITNESPSRRIGIFTRIPSKIVASPDVIIANFVNEMTIGTMLILRKRRYRLSFSASIKKYATERNIENETSAVEMSKTTNSYIVYAREFAAAL